jgi:hypothetical protein
MNYTIARWAAGPLAALTLCAAPAQAQSTGPTSCDEFLPKPREVMGRKAGPSSCMVQQMDVTLDGRALRRLDIGLNGSAEGTVAKAGSYKEYLTNAPDLVFPQAGNPGPLFQAVASYERDKGAAFTLVFPADAAAWNGKLWITVHGRGRSFKQGQLKPWDRYLDRGKPLADLNKYDLLILAKGYALAKTYRTSTEGLGEISATLEDGTTIDYAAFNDSAAYIKDFAAVAKIALERRLGRAPARTYFYGHSAGARIGRGINYTGGLNRGADGKPFFDGLLLDDSAAGTWLPVVMKDGKNVLFTTDAEKAAFVPQLEVSHLMYNAVWGPKNKADFTTASFLENKRRNAQILLDKGLGAKHRVYEIRSISHQGGETLADGRRGPVEILDLSRMMDRFIDLLDDWVDKGTAPPPSRADIAALGGVNNNGTIARPALAFPEVACPLGVYYPYPEDGAGNTAFAAFTGAGLEPRDQKNAFIDMNRNGSWDRRESVREAWQRLGLLKPGEAFTREAYVACATAAAERLQQQGFFSAVTARRYGEMAKQADIEPKGP